MGGLTRHGRPFALLAVAVVGWTSLACNPFSGDNDDGEWLPLREGLGGDMPAESGTLVKQGRCLYVGDPAAGGRLLVLSEDDETLHWDEATQTLTAFGESTRVGDWLDTGGTRMDADEVDEIDFARDPADECDLSNSVLLMIGDPPDATRAR